MTLNTKRWQLKEKIPDDVDNIFEDFPPIIRQILYNRKITSKSDAENFLFGGPFESQDPFLLMDMDKAVSRIIQAIKSQEPIAVYGDYDADGVTATALMVHTLRNLGANVEPYIPNRFDEGYGLNNEALASLYDTGKKLVITVDCGIRAAENAEFANEIGLDLIITDHHHPTSDLPKALAVINPKREDDPYPDKNLAGVGTAYKLACGLTNQVKTGQFNPEYLLDLVAIGTVADLVPLVGENRYLVKKGLSIIRQSNRRGISSLLGVTGISPSKITATDIGFSLGPRLNAAGRLDSALAAYHLLITDDFYEAGELAQQLDNQNRERQKITRDMQERVEELLGQEEEALPFLIFVDDPDFNPGVVGLTASRLSEKYYRPTVVGYHGEEFTRASCRSIDEFHITKALDECAHLLTHHGGHSAAAGFTVANENLASLKNLLLSIATEKLHSLDLRPEIEADAEVNLSDLSFELLKQLEWLEPTGNGNPAPKFISRNLRVINSRTVGKDNTHLKLTVSDGSNRIEAIAFRQGYWHGKLDSKIDVLYRFEANEYRGLVTPQLNILDIKPGNGLS